MAGRRALQVLVALSGFLAWAMQFAIVYGATSTACARGWADAQLFGIGVVPAIVLLATAMAVLIGAAGFGHAARALRRVRTGVASTTDTFLNRTTLLISSLSLVAVAWSGIPGLILPACA